MTMDAGHRWGAGTSRGRRVLAVLALLLVAVVAVLLWRGSDGGARRPSTDDASAAAPSDTSDSVASPTDEPPQERRHVTPAPPEAPSADATADEGPPPEDFLDVLVRTESGAPVRGIPVVVSGGHGVRDSADSGADGRLRLRRPQGDGTLLVTLREEQRRRYLPVETRTLGKDQRAVEVVLVEGELLRGRVVAPDDAPLQSVYLRAVERPGDRELPPVLTDHEGHFWALLRAGSVADLRLVGLARTRIDVVREGTRSLQTEVPWSGRWTGLAPGPGEHALRATRLETLVLRVRVVTPGGEPVSDARVMTRLGRWASTRGHVSTDAEGVAVLRDLFPRPRTIFVLPGRTASEAGWVPPESQELTGTETEITLALRPGATISGRVVRADGEPVVWCGIDVLHGEITIVSGVSEGDGTFTIALPEDAPAPLRLEARQYDRQRRRWEGAVDEVWPGATGVEIEVSLPE